MTRDIKRIVAYYQRKYGTRDPFKIADALGIEVQIGNIGSKADAICILSAADAYGSMKT